MNFKDKVEYSLSSANNALDYLEKLDSKIQYIIYEVTEVRDCLEEFNSDIEIIKQMLG